MFIAVDFSNLKNHQAHLNYELETTDQAAEIIEYNLRQAVYDSAISVDFWEQQYQLINHEIQRIKKRKELLEYIYDTLFEANQRMERIVGESSHLTRESSVEYN